MKDNPNVEMGEASLGIGRGTKCTIKQLKADVDAGLAHMGMDVPRGQGSGFGWGRNQRRRPRFLGPDCYEAEA